jgi:predicted DNA-binding protein
MRDKTTRAIYMPKELEGRIKLMAREKDRSISYIATKLMEKAIENLDQFPITIDSRPIKKGGKK